MNPVLMTRIHRIEVPIPFPLQTVNCYYIHDSIPTLIDTGVDSAACLDILEKKIGAAGGELRNLKRVILTHGHTDHIGLAGKIARLSGAAVFIHAWDSDKIPPRQDRRLAERMTVFHRFMTESGLSAEAAERASQTISRRFRQLISPIDRAFPLKAGAIIAFDDLQLTVLHTPGHSPGSVCLFDPTGGVLIAGDCLLEKITPNPVVEINPPAEDPDYQSLARYESTLKTIEAISAHSVLPGHGRPFKNTARVARQILRHQRDRRDRILGLLPGKAGRSGDNSAQSPYRMARALFPDIGEQEVFLALSEVRSHLDYLLARGLVKMSRKEGIRMYRRSED